jgi:hypothetical protein
VSEEHNKDFERRSNDPIKLLDIDDADNLSILGKGVFK